MALTSNLSTVEILEQLEAMMAVSGSKLGAVSASANGIGNGSYIYNGSSINGPYYPNNNGIANIPTPNTWNSGTYTYSAPNTSVTSKSTLDRLDEIEETLAAINKRLSILVPDPEMLEKWEILRDMYQQYLAAEALLSGIDADE